MKLSSIISNGMVLQRHQTITISGETIPSQTIQLSFLHRTYETTSDRHGNWAIVLGSFNHGGPYVMTISADETLVIEDIFIGDVWLLSGQSNMELPIRRTLDLFSEEMKAVHNPSIRQFSVPQTYQFHQENDFLEGGKWTKAIQNEVLDFSAVGYFFANELYKKYEVPIGLVHAAVGGTPIEAWISEKTLRELHVYDEELHQNKDDSYVSLTKLQDEERHTKWYEQLNANDLGLQKPAWYEENLSTNDWQEFSVPNSWKSSELESLRGAVWFRKEFQLSDEMCTENAKLMLGTIIDADDTYINGTHIGSTAYRYPPRRYNIPAGILKPGKNTLAVRVISTQTTGAFVTDMPYKLIVNSNEINLEGSWSYKIGAITETLDPPTFFQYKPTGMYNGMIAPLKQMTMKGVLWYQGESNTANPSGYAQLFAKLVHDWRTNWQQQDLPFLYTQLSNLENGDPHHHWAILREEQRKSLTIPHTAMAVTIDVGEQNDLHPQDKKSVGQRLALCARHIAYGENIVYSGPHYKEMKRIDGKIKLSFDHIGSGLVTKDGELQAFEICGSDLNFFAATANIKDDHVIVYHDQIQNPVHVRYAWSDNPEEANLYNKEGLPASPFTTE
ncbi:sialate O-acetylesterase [Halalkalibacter sp. AB-rgal2]|uniref:sialate O-acetylesterase n=1 Tax=Halalkalibacter sp. AB-rgal2 TaxID=3242695 RepID=UPI00359DC9E1